MRPLGAARRTCRGNEWRRRRSSDKRCSTPRRRCLKRRSSARGRDRSRVGGSPASQRCRRSSFPSCRARPSSGARHAWTRVQRSNRHGRSAGHAAGCSRHRRHSAARNASRLRWMRPRVPSTQPARHGSRLVSYRWTLAANMPHYSNHGPLRRGVRARPRGRLRQLGRTQSRRQSARLAASKCHTGRSYQPDAGWPAPPTPASGRCRHHRAGRGVPPSRARRARAYRARRAFASWIHARTCTTAPAPRAPAGSRRRPPQDESLSKPQSYFVE